MISRVKSIAKGAPDLGKIIWMSMGILLLTSCSDTENEKISVRQENTAVTAADSSQLISLVRNMYQWYETKGTKGDFMPADIAAGESAYKGIDWKAHEVKVSEMKASQMFSNEFIENYNNIAHHIDQELKEGKTIWQEGDMSPFSSGADAWCNCQDSPEKYWESIPVNVRQADDSHAVLQWSWNEKETYTVKASRENGSWKISWLQGFDFQEFMKQ